MATLQELLAQAEEEARQFREAKGETFFEQLGGGFNRLASKLADIPGAIAFGGFDELQEIRELQKPLGTVHEETLRKPQGFAQKAGRLIGEAVPEVALDTAIVAGTGGLGAGAALSRGAKLFAGGAGAGALTGVAAPDVFGLESRGAGVAVGGVLGGTFGTVLPIALRPLSKYIPGVNKIVPNVTLREAFEQSIRTASLGGESAQFASQLLPRDDVVDSFLQGTPIRLRALGEALDSQTRALRGDLPFRRLKGDPQFQADTIVQKGLKTAGLKSKQVKLVMEFLSTQERSALSLSLDPSAPAIHSGGLPVSEALTRVVQRIPDETAVLKMQKNMAQLLADDQMLTKALAEKGIRRAPLEAVEKELLDLGVPPPAMAFLGPDIMAELTPGAAQRFARAVKKNEPRLRKETTLGALELLKQLRLSAMLTSPSAIAKNIVFNSANLGANLAGRGIAGTFDAAKGRVFGTERKVFAGEMLAMVKGLWQGLNDDLAWYGSLSRNLRESIDRPELPIIGVGSRLLRKQDEFFFNRVFAAEMHAEAYKAALRRGAKGVGTALDMTESILAKEAEKVDVLFHGVQKKVLKKLQKQSVEDIDWINREAARIIKASGNEPVSLVESRLMAERAIFVAREGRGIDRLLNLADTADRITRGAVAVAAPFRRTPANELREFMRATLTDVMGGAYVRMNQDIASGIHPSVARTRMARDLGKAALGTSITAGLVAMAATGAYESIREEGKGRAQKDTERALGVPQQSIRLGDWIIPFHTAGPIGRFFRQAEIIARTGSELDYQNMAREMINMLSDDTFVDDLVGMWEAFQTSEGMQRFAARTGASFVPGAIRQGAKEGQVITRPELFAGDSPLKIAEKGARNVFGQGKPVVGLFGQLATKKGILSSVAGNAVEQGKIAETAQFMLDLGVHKEAPDTKVSGVLFQGTEETDFAQAKGRLQFSAVRRLMDNPQFYEIPPEAQAKLINSQFRAASRLANSRARAAFKHNIPITGRLILTGRVGP